MDDAITDRLPTPTISNARLLTAAEFPRLAEVPPEVEWFANVTNPNTRGAYENAVRDFPRVAGITRPEEFRIVTRPRHRLARRAGPARPWGRHGPAPAGIARLAVRAPLRAQRGDPQSGQRG